MPSPIAGHSPPPTKNWPCPRKPELALGSVPNDPLAKCKAGEFLHDMSNELIQIHGGIGMTDEFDAGFYLKRARVLENAFGNQAFHKDRYATLKGF